MKGNIVIQGGPKVHQIYEMGLSISKEVIKKPVFQVTCLTLFASK